jgi:hypothetical protein
MVVALVALVVASSGTAVAAVTYARNAGAVDGKSAVASGASRADAAGRLVATQRTGADRGRIDSRYLDLAGLAAAARRPSAGLRRPGQRRRAPRRRSAPSRASGP